MRCVTDIVLTEPGVTMASFSVKPLDETTWPDFARLVERHHGVWGGCWCMAFHAEGVGRTKTAAQNRSEKECRVREGRAHAALVYDGATCVGWCQFGPPDELPRIKNKRAYLEGLTVLRIGGSPASSLTRNIGAKGLHPLLSRAHCAISRVWGEERWKATPKPPKVGR
jgi:hypothetical protein